MSSGPTSTEPATGDPIEDEGALGWLELFFDLVVVVAISLLTDGLREHADLGGIALFAVLYMAIWLTWTTYVLYANVAQERAHAQTMMIGMALIAIMAVALPEADNARANVFAGAFLAARGVAMRSSLKTGKLLQGWQLAGGSTAIWVAAMWIDTPHKYWLWAVGLAVDVVYSMVAGPRSAEHTLRGMREHQARQRPRRRSDRDVPDHFETVEIERTHFDDRLGVFVIIVLGEAVTQIVRTFADTEYSRAVGVAGAASFALLMCLWGLIFSYGFAAAPHARIASLPARAALPIHALITGGIVAVAAALGDIVSDPGASLSVVTRWLACGGLATYLVGNLLAGVLAKAPRTWIFGRGAPCVAAALLLGLVGTYVDNEVLIMVLVAIVFWQISYGRRLFERTHPDNA